MSIKTGLLLFGFNGGSVGSIASKENADAVALTILNTNTAGLAGALIGGTLMYIRYKLFDITMILNGIWGTLAVGIFASNPEQGITLMGQIKGFVIVAVFAFPSKLSVLWSTR